MKKKLFGCLIIFSLSFTNSFSETFLPDPSGSLIPDFGDWEKIINGEASAILDLLNSQLNDLIGNGLSVCYVKNKEKAKASYDICGLLENLEGSVDICESAPQIEGYTKKTNVLSASLRLKDICGNVTKYAQSIVTDSDVYTKAKNGTIDDSKFKQEDLVSDKNSLVRNAFLSGNQNVLAMLRDYSEKSKNINSIKDVKLTDLGIPKTLSEYYEQREIQSNSTASDYLSHNIPKISAHMREVANNTQDELMMNATRDVSLEYEEYIDVGSNSRIQAYLDVFASDDDIAMPTQEMVDLLTDEAKPEVIAKIRKQLKKEALIIAEIKQIDNSRKNVLSLISQKSAIVAKKFPKLETAQEIEASLKDIKYTN